MDAWIREYGVRYFSELTNMATLSLGMKLARLLETPVEELFTLEG